MDTNNRIGEFQEKKDNFIYKYQVQIVVLFILFFIVLGLFIVEYELKIVLRGVVLSALMIFHFLEVYTRKERLFLDWWIAPLTVGILVFRDKIPVSVEWWYFILGMCLVLTFIATIVNEYEGESKAGNFDLTTLMVESGYLGILYHIKWDLLPYPDYLPIWVVYVVFGFSLLFELFKTPLLGTLALILGAVSGYFFELWGVAVAYLLVTLLVTLLPKQDWVQSRNNTKYPLSIGNLRLVLIVPWDNIIIQTFLFFAVAFIKYGDAILKIIHFKLP